MKEESNQVPIYVLVIEFFAIAFIAQVAPVLIAILLVVFIILNRLHELITTSKELKQINIEDKIWNKKWLVDQAKIKRQIFETTSSPISFPSLCAQLQQNQPQDSVASSNSIEICLMQMVKDGILIYNQDGYVHKS